ncbi:MAG: SIMPL domain-containing protein [Lentisphaerota bacterium]
MSKNTAKKVFISAILITGLSFISYADCPQKDPPNIFVNGDAKISVPADRAQITLSVVSTAENPQDAIDATRTKMNSLIDAVGKLGLDKTEYKTSAYNLSPNWAPQPRNPKPDWKPQIISYTMTNSLDIKTTKLDLVGKVIQTALNSGTNQIDRIYFDLSDQQKYNAEVIQKAVKSAMSDAKAASEASEVKLGKILSINVNNAYMSGNNDYGRGVFMAKMSSDSMEGSASAPASNIAAGDVTLSASVSLKIQIEQ